MTGRARPVGVLIVVAVLLAVAAAAAANPSPPPPPPVDWAPRSHRIWTDPTAARHHLQPPPSPPPSSSPLLSRLASTAAGVLRAHPALAAAAAVGATALARRAIASRPAYHGPSVLAERRRCLFAVLAELARATRDADVLAEAFADADRCFDSALHDLTNRARFLQTTANNAPAALYNATFGGVHARALARVRSTLRAGRRLDDDAVAAVNRFGDEVVAQWDLGAALATVGTAIGAMLRESWQVGDVRTRVLLELYARAYFDADAANAEPALRRAFVAADIEWFGASAATQSPANRSIAMIAAAGPSMQHLLGRLVPELAPDGDAERHLPAALLYERVVLADWPMSTWDRRQRLGALRDMAHVYAIDPVATVATPFAQYHPATRLHNPTAAANDDDEALRLVTIKVDRLNARLKYEAEARLADRILADAVAHDPEHDARRDPTYRQALLQHAAPHLSLGDGDDDEAARCLGRAYEHVVRGASAPWTDVRAAIPNARLTPNTSDPGAGAVVLTRVAGRSLAALIADGRRRPLQSALDRLDGFTARWFAEVFAPIDAADGRRPYAADIGVGNLLVDATGPDVLVVVQLDRIGYVSAGTQALLRRWFAVFDDLPADGGDDDADLLSIVLCWELECAGPARRRASACRNGDDRFHDLLLPLLQSCPALAAEASPAPDEVVAFADGMRRLRRVYQQVGAAINSTTRVNAADAAVDRFNAIARGFLRPARPAPLRTVLRAPWSAVRQLVGWRRD